jgi:hypothetical protein
MVFAPGTALRYSPQTGEVSGALSSKADASSSNRNLALRAQEKGIQG